MTQPAPALKRIPRLWAALLHLAALALAGALFAGRTLAAFRWEVVLDRAPDFYSHVSNFSISYFLYAGIGYLWLALGVPMRAIAWLGLVLAAANLVYETAIPVLNTPDPVDALYGLAGTAFGAALLIAIDRYGLQPAPGRSRSA
ncbi:MAG TPA: hypothetical protein VMR06_00035 [Dokdonella sp.]|uniref:hypothetical protein n=1 Tax=Dokdonella sp. TaxID=2291710 RepID=UPI002C29B99C|nr:hypothetical protein [Dokdonella sp.]HUD40370.1 hypothetical protein [Dokdonella sp.]